MTEAIAFECAIHALVGNEVTVRVADADAYVEFQVVCFSENSLDGPICFGKSERHVLLP